MEEQVALILLVGRPSAALCILWHLERPVIEEKSESEYLVWTPIMTIVKSSCAAVGFLLVEPLVSRIVQPGRLRFRRVLESSAVLG